MKVEIIKNSFVPKNAEVKNGVISFSLNDVPDDCADISLRNAKKEYLENKK